MLNFLIWCAIFLISILIELSSPGFFFFLSFSIGAASAAIVSLISDNLVLQIICFMIFSVISFIILKYLFVRKTAPGPASDLSFSSNVYALIGKNGIVFEDINFKKNEVRPAGSVKINGEIWSAKSLDNEQIKAGEIVEVIDVRGAHVIVKKRRAE